MKSLDTNVVIRVILGDDPIQTPIAMACVEQGVFVSNSVLLETEWVLRSRGLRRADVNAALDGFIALQSVSVAHPDRLAWALDRHRAGADWADMLHLIASAGHDAFVTFEKKLRAGDAPPVPVELLA